MNSPDKVQFERSASQARDNHARDRQPALVKGIQVLANWRVRSRTGHFMMAGLAAFVIGVIVGSPTLSYSGFCFSKGRFLSDQEYINIAISRIMSLTCYQLTSPIFKCVPPIPYEDVVDFRARNPDCCKFVRHNSDFAGSGIVTFSQQLFGYAARSVLVNFKITDVDADGHPRDTTGNGLIVVGNCGGVLNRGH